MFPQQCEHFFAFFHHFEILSTSSSLCCLDILQLIRCNVFLADAGSLQEKLAGEILLSFNIITFAKLYENFSHVKTRITGKEQIICTLPCKNGERLL